LLGIGERTFRRWRRRYDEEGEAGLWTAVWARRRGLFSKLGPCFIETEFRYSRQGSRLIGRLPAWFFGKAEDAGHKAAAFDRPIDVPFRFHGTINLELILQVSEKTIERPET
jgi:hypothetical protein